MQGVVTTLNEEQCVLLGGHTAEGAELQVGLVVNAEPNPVTHEHAEQSTDPLEEYALVLTKPLGVGVVFAGLMQTKTKGADVDAALNSMLQSNADAAAICKRHGMPVCTDVTGFGLLGHLQRLALREGVSVEIHEENVPVLEGVHDLVNQGVQSSLSAANQSMLDPIPALSGLSKSNRVIFTDPQTCGGLVALVPVSRTESCLEELRSTGYQNACVIGHALYVRDDSAIAGIVSLR